jgi:hypothetical protein
VAVSNDGLSSLYLDLVGTVHFFSVERVMWNDYKQLIY